MEDKGSITAEDLSNEVGVSVILAKERYYSCKQHYSLLVTCVMLARYLKSCKNKEEVLVYCNPSPVWPCIFHNLVVEWLLFLRTLDSWNLNQLTYELNIYSLKLKLRKSFCKGVWTSHLFLWIYWENIDFNFSHLFIVLLWLMGLSFL